MNPNRKRKLVLGVVVACKQYCMNIIGDFSDSDSHDSHDDMEGFQFKRILAHFSPERNSVPRIENYFELVVPSYSDQAFQQHFRLTRNSFAILLTLVEPVLTTRYEYGRPREQITKKLLAVLWLLATPDSYRSVGDRFDLGKASLSDWFFRIIKALNTLAPTLIQWPHNGKKAAIKNRFQQFANFPNVIGAVDGTYVPIKKPELHPEAYLTRKCCYAFTLQGISESSLKFIDVFTGYPGSVSDHRIFTNSTIYSNIVQDPRQYFDNEYILGDKAYPLTTWCITPYINRGYLTPSQLFFNEAHAKTRQVIERTFCLLFGRWRHLKYLDMTCTDLIPITVVGACVLHNLCIENDGDNEAYIEEGRGILQEIGNQENNIRRDGRHDLDGEDVNHLAQMIRDNISLNLFINHRR